MIRTCLACGDDIEKKKNEAAHIYKKRKFCSVYCARKYLKKSKSGWYARSNANPDIVTIDDETYDQIMNRQAYSKQQEYKRLGHEFEEQLIKDLGLQNP